MSALQLCIDFYEKSHGVTNQNITHEQYNILSQIQSQLSLCDVSVPVCEQEEWDKVVSENTNFLNTLPNVQSILNHLNNLLSFEPIKLTVQVYNILRSLHKNVKGLSEQNYDILINIMWKINTFKNKSEVLDEKKWKELRPKLIIDPKTNRLQAGQVSVLMPKNPTNISSTIEQINKILFHNQSRILILKEEKEKKRLEQEKTQKQKELEAQKQKELERRKTIDKELQEAQAAQELLEKQQQEAAAKLQQVQQEHAKIKEAEAAEQGDEPDSPKWDNNPAQVELVTQEPEVVIEVPEVVAEEPEVVAEPEVAVEEPAAEEPAAEEPAPEEPEPAAEEPEVAEPEVAEPEVVAEEPAAEEPEVVAEEPAVEAAEEPEVADSKKKNKKKKSKK